MTIDIFAHWEGQTKAEKDAQLAVCECLNVGHLGYLCEPHLGHPYATSYFVQEAFEVEAGVCIPAAKLRQRLPDTLRLAESRARHVYGIKTNDGITRILQSFTAFVQLCEQKEKETGSPVRIFASW